MTAIDRRVFLGALGACLATPAFGLNEGAAAVTVEVQPQTRLGQLPAMGLGFSTEKHLIGLGDFYVPANTDFTGLCKRLGPQVLRVGGTHVDHTTWSPNGAGHVNGTVAPSDIERFAAYVKMIGWKVVYGINLAHAPAKDSADEAQVAAKYLGDSLLAFEIGNEPDLFVNHDDRPKGYGYADFLPEWRGHAAALRAAVPNAPICGPGAFGAWRQYGLPFAKDTQGQVQILTQHYYRMSGKKPEATLESLITGMPVLFEEIKSLVQAAKENNIPGGFRMIETNSFVGGGLDGVSDRSAAALWAVEYALRAAEIGARGLNFQIGPAGHSNSCIAMGPGTHVSEIRPQFYALLMIAEMGTGTMLGTTLTGAPPQVSAFSMDDAAGKRNVVLNNFSEAGPLTVEVHTGGAASAAETMLLAGGSLKSTSCTMGGATLRTDGKGDLQWTPVQGRGGVFSVTLPAASAMRLRTKL